MTYFHTGSALSSAQGVSRSCSGWEGVGPLAMVVRHNLLLRLKPVGQQNNEFIESIVYQRF